MQKSFLLYLVSISFSGYIAYSFLFFNLCRFPVRPRDVIFAKVDDIKFTPNTYAIPELVPIPRNVSEYIRNRVRSELNATLVRPEFFGNLTRDDLLSKFVPENNGRPIQSILLSTWRSGSSFIGELLASVPNTLYYFEPLHYLHDSRGYRFQVPPRSDEALNLLRTLLTCNHHSSSILSQALKTISSSFLPRLYPHEDVCGVNMSLCRTTDLTESLCKMSPFHLIKLVRLHLNQTENLLVDDSLTSVKLLYLVRDPRGTMNSRMTAPFCKQDAYFTDPSILCDDLESEFYAAMRLISRFPNRLKIVRYEDLAENVVPVTTELLNFLGFEMHPRVVEFIERHAKSSNVKGSTFGVKRNSSGTAVQWTRDMSFDDVQKIQTYCAKPMQLWGYKIANNATELKNFVPYSRREEYVVQKVITSR